MNRLFAAMLVAGSFALLLGSCKKNETVSNMTVGLPQFEEELDGRAYIDINNGNAFRWNSGDEIVVYNLDANEVQTPQRAIYQANANAQGQGNASFDFKEGDQIGAKMSGYFVFYPAAKINLNNQLGADNHETFTVSNEQTYALSPSNNPTVDAAGMALAATLNSLDGNFSLKHIFGILKLRVKGTGNVTKIVVEDNRFNLSGSVTMKLHKVNMNTFTTLQNYFIGTNDPDNNLTFMNAWTAYKTELDYSVAQGGGKTMTLKCPGVALNTSTETLFFIGLRPGALKYGYTIKVYTDNDVLAATFTNDANWNYGIKAGIVKNLVLSF